MFVFNENISFFLVFSIQDSIVKLEQQHKDLEEVWRKKYGPLRKWITAAQARLNKDYAIAPDLDSVKKQHKDIEVSFDCWVDKFVCEIVDWLVCEPTDPSQAWLGFVHLFLSLLLFLFVTDVAFQFEVKGEHGRR